MESDLDMKNENYEESFLSYNNVINTGSEESKFSISACDFCEGIYINDKKFAPKDDMTPVESARISQLFTLISLNSNLQWISNDRWSKFISDYGLERHFE